MTDLLNRLDDLVPALRLVLRLYATAAALVGRRVYEDWSSD